ncbi:MAG: hypothetical protein ACPGVU_15970 [Limisphaerales bacterium]
MPSHEVSATDFLKGNPHVYAHKARRKKIALIKLDLTNDGDGPVEFELGSAKLIAGGNRHDIDAPETLIKKFREFTWGFIIFAILDFHPLLIMCDLLFLIMGPLYNRRLRRQLRDLTNESIHLKAGEKKTVVLGFLTVKQAPEQIQVRHRAENADWITTDYAVPRDQ